MTGVAVRVFVDDTDLHAILEKRESKNETCRPRAGLCEEISETQRSFTIARHNVLTMSTGRGAAAILCSSRFDLGGALCYALRTTPMLVILI